MSVAEYRDKFTELSRYATEEVAKDKKKQELFLDGLKDRYSEPERGGVNGSR
jgi:hypothetical protein